jgi:hypothetical protein
MRAVVLLSLMILLPGCTTPTQYGGLIQVDTAGFARRMEWLCHWGMQGAKASACAQEPKQLAARQQGADAELGAEPQAEPIQGQEPSAVIATAPEEADGGETPSH